jgi:YfiH family protein
VTEKQAQIAPWDAGLPVRAFFTSRHGGVSEAPFDTLNLSRLTEDDPVAVAANRARAEALAGAPIAYPVQVHGSTVAVVSVPGGSLEADAIITVTPGLAVGVLVADCVPLLVYDVGSGAVAAVHAGREGVARGVVGAAIDALRDIGGSRSGRLIAATGPAICGACYEVPVEMRASVAAIVPEAWAETSWGTPSLDLIAAVQAQARAAGVNVISSVGPCTRESVDQFSHRREGATGRAAGIIVCAR